MFPLPHICKVSSIQSVTLSVVTDRNLEGFWEGCIATAGFVKSFETLLPYSWREIKGVQCLISVMNLNQLVIPMNLGRTCLVHHIDKILGVVSTEATYLVAFILVREHHFDKQGQFTWFESTSTQALAGRGVGGRGRGFIKEQLVLFAGFTPGAKNVPLSVGESVAALPGWSGWPDVMEAAPPMTTSLSGCKLGTARTASIF
jgi:hypothetical protein